MNDVERQLTDLLKTGVGDPPAHVTVQAVQRQRARRRLAAAGGAAVAVVVVVAASVGLSGALEHRAIGPTASGCRPGWSVASGAVPAGDSQDSVTAISGSASDDLWAVGHRSPHHSQKLFPLFEHWNGHRWTYSAGATLGGRQAALTAVAAPASNDVWAVGEFVGGPSFPGAPLVEHWNGRSWSLQPTEVLTSAKKALNSSKAVWPNVLYAVAALAPNDVWIFGTSTATFKAWNTISGISLHWDGSSWHLTMPVDSPNFGFAGMNAISSDHLAGLWAVGGWLPPNSEPGIPSGGVAEQMTDGQWKVAKRMAWNEPLTLVAPVAPDDVWAIAGGNFTSTAADGIGPIRVLHWNGTAWRVALTLSGSTSQNPVDPIGLVAPSAEDVYVMGQNSAPTNKRPFIDHWDGTRWRSLPLGPAGHLRQPDQALTVTSNGSVAALVSPQNTDKTNYLWVQC